jgi:hypothetical protein
MAVDPPTQASIKVIKRMPYRGVTKDWSNRYFFDGSAPADNTKWTTFSDAVVTAEKAIYHNESGYSIIGTVGYAAGSEIPVFSKTYTQVGTLTLTSYQLMPGDVAALVRYSTADRSEKNHPIYLFNYYHWVNADLSGPFDELKSTQRTAMGTYANLWISGISDGTVSHHRTGPYGHAATGQTVNQYLRHRDFPAG